MAMPFKKGQSGNPGGRTKKLVDVQALAQAKTKSNIEGIAFLAENAMDEGVRLRAREILYKIGWGNYVQAITGPGGGPIQHEHGLSKSIVDILRNPS